MRDVADPHLERAHSAVISLLLSDRSIGELESIVTHWIMMIMMMMMDMR